MCLALQMISQQNRNTESLREGILWGGGWYLPVWYQWVRLDTFWWWRCRSYCLRLGRRVHTWVCWAVWREKRWNCPHPRRTKYRIGNRAVPAESGATSAADALRPDRRVPRTAWGSSCFHCLVLSLCLQPLRASEAGSVCTTWPRSETKPTLSSLQIMTSRKVFLDLFCFAPPLPA